VSVSPNVGIKPLNWVPKPVLNSAAAFIAFMALRSRFRHFARRFLNHTLTLASVKFVHIAISSLVLISGYRFLAKVASSS
jgi:hypothetical protein